MNFLDQQNLRVQAEIERERINGRKSSNVHSAEVQNLDNLTNEGVTDDLELLGPVATANFFKMIL
ncbi:MAG: hypothetical protein WBA20_02465 [Ketobacter sp.]